jgi:hypothetical protein
LINARLNTALKTKEKDKEKKALDIFLHHNAFTSRSKCDKEADNGSPVNSD